MNPVKETGLRSQLRYSPKPEQKMNICPPVPPREETVRMAADLAATFSGVPEGGRAAVDCALVRNVKKPAGAKPGRVIYTDYKTLIGRSDPKLKERTAE